MEGGVLEENGSMIRSGNKIGSLWGEIDNV
jgi:hypothetical protein